MNSKKCKPQWKTTSGWKTKTQLNVSRVRVRSRCPGGNIIVGTVEGFFVILVRITPCRCRRALNRWGCVIFVIRRCWRGIRRVLVELLSIVGFSGGFGGGKLWNMARRSLNLLKKWTSCSHLGEGVFRFWVFWGIKMNIFDYRKWSTFLLKMTETDWLSGYRDMFSSKKSAVWRM